MLFVIVVVSLNCLMLQWGMECWILLKYILCFVSSFDKNWVLLVYMLVFGLSLFFVVCVKLFDG